MKWTLNDVVSAINAKAASTVGSEFQRIGTDSRGDLTGQLFIALKGPQFDGHNFVGEAVARGAAGLIVHDTAKITPDILQKVTVLTVSDTLEALQNLARAYRKKCGFKVIGITGSNGKTTTKEFTKELLQTKFRVHSSRGSFNNHWGVPLTLLAAPADTEFVVQEMGMNHSGELTHLAQIALPDIVVVTTVGRAHIGELGSQEAIARAKEELYVACPQAAAIFNLDNEFTMAMHERSMMDKHRAKIFTFSSFRDGVNIMLRANRVWLEQIEITGHVGNVSNTVTVGISGRHNITNVMAASCIALAAGMAPMEVWAAYPHFKATWGRGQLLKHPSGAQIVFDGYNANPESTAALIRNMLEVEVRGRKVAILGEMLELGSHAGKAHQELGEIAGGGGYHEIWFIGNHAADFEAGLKKVNSSTVFFQSPAFDINLAQYFNQRMGAGDVVIIKGSRGIKMEQILDQWRISPGGKD